MNEILDQEILKLKLEEIRKDFYRYRNGMVADSIKKINPGFHQIFGLLLPQISEISRQYSQNASLAMTLWNQTDSRESRILALYLFPLDSVNTHIALSLIEGIKSIEEAELLPFILLRKLPFACDLYSLAVSKLGSYGSETPIYHCLKMLAKNIGITD